MVTTARTTGPDAIFRAPSPIPLLLVYLSGSVSRKTVLTQSVCVCVLTGWKISWGWGTSTQSQDTILGQPTRAGLSGPAWSSPATPEPFSVFFQVPSPGLNESPWTKLEALCCKIRGQANLERGCLPCLCPAPRSPALPFLPSFLPHERLTPSSSTTPSC